MKIRRLSLKALFSKNYRVIQPLSRSRRLLLAINKFQQQNISSTNIAFTDFDTWRCTKAQKKSLRWQYASTTVVKNVSSLFQRFLFKPKCENNAKWKHLLQNAAD